MAAMRAAWKQMEKGQRPGKQMDGWEHPMQFRSSGSRHWIRAAASDGRFEAKPLPAKAVTTHAWDADILLVDGRFMQYPEGICAGDEPGKGPLGDCMSCHPHHIAKR